MLTSLLHLTISLCTKLSSDEVPLCAFRCLLMSSACNNDAVITVSSNEFTLHNKRWIIIAPFVLIKFTAWRVITVVL